MALPGDNRAQSIQVGAVLLFGILVISLAIYQSQIVPAENKEVEFDHHQTVQQRMVDLRNALLTSAITGASRPAAIPLGTTYPTRMFAVNPPPPGGELETSHLGSITLSNAVALNPHTADYLNGSDQSFETEALVFTPDYSEILRPTSFIYESSLLYSFLPQDQGTFVEAFTGQEVIEGSTIRLTALRGNLSETGTDSVSVEPEVLSGGFTAVQITNASGGPVVLTLPTRLPAEEWADLVSSPRVLDVSAARNGTAVRFELAPGTYTLKMAKIGVGDGATDPEPRYVLPVGTNQTSVGEGTTSTITFEVRDRYNNPVTNALVNVTGNASLPGTLRGPEGEVVTEDEPLQTDAEGQLTLTYEAPDVQGSGLGFSIYGNISGEPKTERDPAYASVSVSVVNTDRSGTGNGSGGGAGGVNPSSGNLVVYEGVEDFNDTTVEIILNNLDTDLPRMIADIRFSFFSSDGQGAAATDVPDSLRIEGEDATFLRNGDYKSVNMLFAPGERRTVNITFYKNDVLWTDLSGGDYFVLSVIYGNGSTSNFFISPSSSPTGGSGAGGGGSGGAVTFNDTTVTDNTTGKGNPKDVNYTMDYEVDGTDYKNVTVEVIDGGDTTVATFNSTAQSDTFQYSETRNANGNWEFVFRIYDEFGNLLDSQTITDKPNGSSGRTAPSTRVDARIDTH